MTLPNYTRAQNLAATLRERLVIMDGAMGTMLQLLKLTEEQYRGERFKDFTRDVKGNNDLLGLSVVGRDAESREWLSCRTHGRIRPCSSAGSPKPSGSGTSPAMAI